MGRGSDWDDDFENDDNEEETSVVTLHEANVDLAKVNAKYAKNVGEFCPICNYDEVDREAGLDGDGKVIVSAHCYNCESSWEEVWTFGNVRAVTLESSIAEFEIYPGPNGEEGTLDDILRENHDQQSAAKPERNVVMATAVGGVPTDWYAE